MMCTICDMVNASELEQEQLLDDIEEVSSGGEGDNASVGSGGSQREVPHSQYTIEQRLEGVDAAEMEEAAAAAAAEIVRMNRSEDATLLFNLQEGRIDAGEVGVDPWVNPAESVVAESFHASDIASVAARTEVTLVTEGAASALPDHAGPEVAESLTIGSEAGWAATERPPAVHGLPLQPKGNFNYIPSNQISSPRH